MKKYIYLIVSYSLSLAGSDTHEQHEQRQHTIDIYCNQFVQHVEKEERRHAKRSFAMQLVASGLGMGLMYKIHSLGPVNSFHQARMVPFLSAELAGIIQPFILPTVGLIVGGVAYHKFKSSLIYPYKVKYKESIDALKKSVDDHMKQVADEHDKNIQEILGILEGQEKARTEQIVELEKQVGNHVQEMHKQLAQSQDNLNDTREAVTQARETNTHLQETLNILVPRVEGIHKLTSQLSKQVAAESILLQELVKKKKAKAGSTWFTPAS